MKKALAKGEIRIQGLETAAWTVTSSGGLLVQVDKDLLDEITQAYYNVELVNKYHAHILDMSAGVLSALGGVENTRARYMQLLGNTLNVLEPKLQAIVQRKTK